MDIKLTDKAKKKLEDEYSKGKYYKIVSMGCCQGAKFEFLSMPREPEDQIFKIEGLAIGVDSDVDDILKDVTIDYIEGFIQKRFKIYLN